MSTLISDIIEEQLKESGLDAHYHFERNAKQKSLDYQFRKKLDQEARKWAMDD